MATDDFIGQLLGEVLRDSHSYTPGHEQRVPTLRSGRSGSERLRVFCREYARDLLERALTRAGFSHRHFDPDAAGERLRRILELSTGLEITYERLADEASKRALLDVLKLRVLGAHHARLRVTPQEFRRHQLRIEQQLCLERGTFAVSDPYFSPLSLYRISANGYDQISLHAHSVDLVSVFLLGQYSYSRGPTHVSVQPGDVVLDVGGCWGDTALYFASLVGAQGKVYTFEVDPESLQILRTNLALNPELARRVEVVPVALWRKSDETLEFAQAGRMTTVLEEKRGGAVSATTLTLDDFVTRHGLNRVDFVKMDVEGAELDVLDGARETLERFGPKLGVAAYHRDDDLVRIPETLLAINDGYRFYLESYSPIEDETVLFADSPPATDRSRRT